MKFDKAYTQYWVGAVNKSIDGTIIAGADHVRHFLHKLTIKRDHKVLDLGCSFGRMNEVLSQYSEHVYGVEPDAFAVSEAAKKPYVEVKQGVAENTGFAANTFDFVFCWAVFDLVDHKKGLLEFNRILRIGGDLLLTGKNNLYFDDDVQGFTAEKNAFLKAHPNKFTDLKTLKEKIHLLGFKLNSLVIFDRRGDMGLLKYREQPSDAIEIVGYEYLLHASKIGDANESDLASIDLDSGFTQTANAMAKAKGYDHPRAMFESMGMT